jgi:transmembrane sensor
MKNIDEALLARYLQQDTDKAENEAVAQWRQDLPTNEQTLQDIEKIWAKTEALKPDFPTFDADKAWAKMALAIEPTDEKPKEKEAKIVELAPKTKVRSLWGSSGLRIAMSVALLVAVGWVFYNNFYNEGEKQYAQITKTKQDVAKLTLDDKSTVVLGHNAKIMYPEKFGKKDRTVQFEGQAHFSITPDASRPFIIKTSEEAVVKVLGTSFSVTSYANTKQVEVNVTSGKVELSHEEQKVVLQVGETGIYVDNKISKKATQQTEKQQKESKFSLNFDNTPLAQVIDQLNVRCGAKLALSPALQKCPLTVKFESQDLETMLQIIVETLELTTQAGEQGYMILNGKGCL